MRKFRFMGLALVLMLLLMCSTNVFAAYDGTSTDVILQGFHWESHQYGWWNTVNQNADAIQTAGFNMVWLPPCSKAGSDEGYLPTEWYNLTSNYGNQAALQTAISALHTRNIKVLADIVVNHRNGSTNWADFTNPSFANNNQAVCSNDEWGQGTGATDTGETYAAARDLDHTYSSVQTEIKNWMGWLKNTIGFDGWRYDFVKGYSGSYVASYNDYTTPYYSVGEFWPTNYFDANNPDNWRQQIINWVNATGSKSAAFDFVTKPLLAQAFNNGEYYRLKDSSNKPAGTIGWWPAKSVTFLDNHDTGPSPGGGQNHWPFPSANVAAGYAYILTHPGIPCVYWAHYFDWGTDLQNQIRTMISIRKSQGITSTSTVSIQVADSSKYAAIIDNKVAVKIGPGSWSPSGSWTLAASGTNYAIWTASSPTPPAAPTNLTATASGTTINLAWTASTGATSYTIYRSTSSTGTYSQVGTSTTNSYSNSGLTASTTYYYKATASNSAGTSGDSNVASATTGTNTGITVHFKNNSVTNWSTLNCYYWGSNGSPASNTWPGASMTSEGNSWYSFVIPGSSSNIIFNNGSTQTVDLSRTAEGWFVPTGTSSSKITGTWYASNPDNPPAAPTSLTATASGTTINLTWTASTGATSYTIYRSASSTGTYSQVGTSTTNSYSDSGLTASTTYYYKVTASNSYGTSANSDVASATTGNGGTVTTTIKINYNCGYGNTIYIRGSISPFNWTTGVAATWTTGNVWTYTTTAIPAGTTFQFKALINDSTWSTSANATGTGGQTITITPTF